MRTLVALPIALALFLAQPAFSFLIVDDRAGATGLVWSSPANTVNLSYDAVVAGGWYDAGWRHASFTEVCGLFAASADYTLACPPGGLQDFGDLGAADFVIFDGDWGFTYYNYDACDPIFDPKPGCSEPYISETKELDGLFDDGAVGDGLVGRAWVYEDRSEGAPGTRRYQSASVAGNATSSGLADATTGHWLVCPSGTCGTPTVPEPKLGALLIGSLALLLSGAFRRSAR